MDMASTYAAMNASPFPVTTLIEGEANGADRYGWMWATERGIPVDPHPADWDRWGKAAGHRRNREMAAKAEAAVIVWDGESRGTAGMMDVCAELDVPHVIYGPLPMERDVEYGDLSDAY